MELRILYENKNLMAVFKPQGIATETKNVLSEDMVSLVRKNPGSRTGAYPAEPVHRLDQPAAGILVFAKDKETFRSLSKQFSGHECDKRYYAVIEGALRGNLADTSSGGDPEKEGIRLSHYIKKEQSKSGTKAIICEPSEPGAKKAELIYKITKIFENPSRSLLDIKLLTGRFHQIRAQLSGIGHPILGDVKYGGKSNWTDSGKKGPSGGIALLCYSLTITDPGSGKRLTFYLDENDPAIVDFLRNYG